MEVRLQNIGAFKETKFTPGDLTVICGKNNTGKTYATYAYYGFLRFFDTLYNPDLEDLVPLNRVVRELQAHGRSQLQSDLPLDKILIKLCQKYTLLLPKVFGTEDKSFADAGFSVNLGDSLTSPTAYQTEVRPQSGGVLKIAQVQGTQVINISYVQDKTRLPAEQEYSYFYLSWAIWLGFLGVHFGRLFPPPFIISAERTGAALFQKELDFARNRLVEELSSQDRNLDPFALLDKVYAGYAQPVRENVDFVRRLDTIEKGESFLVGTRPDILEHFDRIAMGTYRIVRGTVYYSPNKGNKRLRVGDASSSVRSLLNLNYYLRHIARKGDQLIFDEPEQNLHPENQCLLARLLVRLVNEGVKVFITTHSDYILKEFNTLIMLNQKTAHSEQVRLEAGYKEDEILDPQRVKVYIAEQKTRIQGAMVLNPAKIEPEQGIWAPSFDDTINQMNHVQNQLLFGERGADE